MAEAAQVVVAIADHAPVAEVIEVGTVEAARVVIAETAVVIVAIVVAMMARPKLTSTS